MFLSLFNHTGNWNPQLFRELKGRLTFRNVAIAVTLSSLTQILVILYFWNILGPFAINWQYWWQDIFQALSGILALALLLGGVYMLISDMIQEERRGTLNFIRLSPQSSQSILIGKMLGVPIVLYIAIALAVPLHLYSAFKGAVPLGVVIGCDLILAAFCTCCYSLSLLYALLRGAQVWLGMVLASLLIAHFLVMLWVLFYIGLANNNALNWFGGLRWFHLSIGHNLALFYSFCLFSLTGISYGIWQILNRRFRNPNATIISKLQSYVLVIFCQLWLLGFNFLGFNLFSTLLGSSILFFFSLLGFLILIATLSPQRQPLQDWARYRQSKVTSGKSFWNWPILQDLIMGEKSPTLVAIALNLAITSMIWIPWILLLPNNTDWFLKPGKIPVMLVWLLTANLILICAALAQLILLMKARKPQLWAAGTVGAILGLPIMVSARLSLRPQTYPVLWLFSAMPVLAVEFVSVTTICLAILAQWSTLILLSLQLTRQLRKAGESASKALITT